MSDPMGFDPDDTGFVFVVWKFLGKPCPHDVSPHPDRRSRCSQPLDVESMVRLPVGPQNGPQGVYVCPDGHRGWIWLRDCEAPT